MGKTIRSEDSPYSLPKIEQLRESFKSAIPYLTPMPKTDETRLWKTQCMELFNIISFR
jgi:hypothetical protein